jgi:tetratricopeptide (TPR) repeat protein
VEHYEKALAADAGNGTVRLNLARAYVGAGNLTRARDAYGELLRIDPKNWDALFEIGQTCAGLEDAMAAKEYLGKLLKENPGYAGKAEAARILAGL